MSLRSNLGVNGFPLPVGAILPFAGDATILPNCWEFCDGSVRSVADYEELYLTIKRSYTDATDPQEAFFNLPALGGNNTYLYPSDTLQVNTDGVNTTGNVLPPEIQVADGDEIIIPLASIPNFQNVNLDVVEPTIQNGVARITLATRGSYPASAYYACGDCGASPNIVKLDATREAGGTFTLNSVDYAFKNKQNNTAVPPVAVDAQVPITTITTDGVHDVQYGGWVMPMIIKVSSFLEDPDGYNRKNWGALRDAALALKAFQALQAAALATQINEDNQREDQEAKDGELAIEEQGQGGGTSIPYAAPATAPPGKGGDCPNLAGFIFDGSLPI